MSGEQPPSEVQVTQEGPAPQPKEPTLIEELLSKPRMILFAVVLIAEVALYLGGLVTPMDQASSRILANQTSSQFGFVQEGNPGVTFVVIFAHNASIGLPEMIPVLGAVRMGLSIYLTGLATQAVVVSQGLPGSFGLILFLLPYSLVELSAYAIAVAAGVMLVLSAWRKRFRHELKIFFVQAVAVSIVLLVAAGMETLTLISFGLGLALWIPTALVIVGIVFVARKVPR